MNLKNQSRSYDDKNNKSLHIFNYNHKYKDDFAVKRYPHEKDYIYVNNSQSLTRNEIINKFFSDPVLSIGIIAFYIDYPYDKNLKTKKILENYEIDSNEKYKNIKLLFIQRKHSIGYTDFIRGRYFYNEPNYMTKIFINEMTTDEIERIKNLSFQELWDDLWLDHSSNHYKYDFSKAKHKYSKLNIKKLIDNNKSNYEHTEFGFPKGRINKFKETEIQCAVREFEEETGYSKNNYNILNIPIIEENFTGTNFVKYIHKYYFAQMKKNITIPEIKNMFQQDETCNLDFLSYNECIKLIRPYETSKKDLIEKTFSCIYNYINDDDVFKIDL